MNKLMVLAKSRNTFFIKRLIHEVGERNLVFINPWVDQYDGPCDGKILVRTSGVYGDDRDLNFLEKSMRPGNIINPLPALKVLRNKVLQYQLFPRLKICVLPWMNLEHATLEQVSDFIERHPSLKFLIKPHRGQGGWGIEVFTRQGLLLWFQSQSDKEYLLQPFLEEVVELRYFFIGDEGVTLCRERSGQAGANYSLGGKAMIVDHFDEIKTFVSKFTSAYPMAYGSIDVLKLKDTFYVLEINSVPGIEQLEEVSGQNIIQSLLNQLHF